MSQSSVDAVRGLYEAFGRADIAAILAALDENIDWSSPENLPHGGNFRGRDGVGRFFQGIGENWEELKVDVEEVVSEGERVVVLLRAHGRLRANAEETGYTAAHAWTLRDGTPTRFVEYVNAPLTLPAADIATAT
jgi:ketosteroid isomerase-like protein